jgi:hypothetical protein
MDTKLNLLQRINEVRRKVAFIQKDKDVSTGGGSYKAVTHDQVTAFTRAALVEFGVVSWPSIVSSKMNDKEEGAKQARYEATYDFTFANCDDMTQTIVIRIESHAMDNADKAPGKALSYAKKYALLKLLDIETGEDDESRIPEYFDPEPYLRSMEVAKDNDSLNFAYEALKEAAKGRVDNSDMRAYATQRNELSKKLPLDDDRFKSMMDAVMTKRTTKEIAGKYNLTAAQRKILDDMP